MYGSRPESDLLFCKYDGMAARRAQVDRAGSEVDDLSERKILSKTDDEIVGEIQQKLVVHVPVLKRGDISYERKTQTLDRQDMWGDMVRMEVTIFYFDVPYDGEDIFFAMQPSMFSSNPPRGQARSNVLRISVQGEEDAAKLQQQVNSTLDNVDQYLGWHRQLWAGVEADVANAARGRLAQRRQKLSTLGQAEAGLAGLGFKPKGG